MSAAGAVADATRRSGRSPSKATGRDHSSRRVPAISIVERRDLDKVSIVDLGFPHEFLKLDFLRKVIGGDLVDRFAFDPNRPRI
jgi:hypothetical protein